MLGVACSVPESCVAGAPSSTERRITGHTTRGGQSLALPLGLKRKLDSWGPALKSRVAAGRAQWLQEHARGVGVLVY